MDASNFNVSFQTGKLTGTDEENFQNFALYLQPIYIATSRIERNGQFAGSMDNERIAEKLRDPEAYYRK